MSIPSLDDYPNMHDDWKNFFYNEQYQVNSRIARIYRKAIQLECDIYPRREDIFNAFSMKLSDIKCVIIGQDPYPGFDKDRNEPVACGYSFATRSSTMPASMRRMFDAIRTKYGNITFTDHTLRGWINQGVLLINDTPFLFKPAENVELRDTDKNFANQRWGITSEICKYIKENTNGVRFILLGTHAHYIEKFISGTATANHPSPLSAIEFTGDCFDSCPEVDWTKHKMDQIIKSLFPPGIETYTEILPYYEKYSDTFVLRTNIDITINCLLDVFVFMIENSDLNSSDFDDAIIQQQLRFIEQHKIIQQSYIESMEIIFSSIIDQRKLHNRFANSIDRNCTYFDDDFNILIYNLKNCFLNFSFEIQHELINRKIRNWGNLDYCLFVFYHYDEIINYNSVFFIVQRYNKNKNFFSLLENIIYFEDDIIEKIGNQCDIRNLVLKCQEHRDLHGI